MIIVKVDYIILRQVFLDAMDTLQESDVVCPFIGPSEAKIAAESMYESLLDYCVESK